MGYYESDSALYEELGPVLRNVLGNERCLGALLAADVITRLACVEPLAEITCHTRATAVPQIELGQSRARPDLVLLMAADTARDLLFGRRSPLPMLAGGEIQVKGAVGKVMTVLDAFVGAASVEVDRELPPMTGAVEAAEQPSATDQSSTSA